MSSTDQLQHAPALKKTEESSSLGPLAPWVDCALKPLPLFQFCNISMDKSHPVLPSYRKQQGCSLRGSEWAQRHPVILWGPGSGIGDTKKVLDEMGFGDRKMQSI